MYQDHQILNKYIKKREIIKILFLKFNQIVLIPTFYLNKNFLEKKYYK